MSKFTNARDAAEAWFAHGWHVVLETIAPAAKQFAQAEMTSILTAGIAAHENGADKAGMKDALLGAATNTAKTVGAEVGLDAIKDLANLALAHLTTGPTGQAPAPETAQ